MRSSAKEMDALSFTCDSNPNGSWPDLQQAVTINIFRKPYFPPLSMEMKVVVQAANLSVKVICCLYSHLVLSIDILTNV